MSDSLFKACVGPHPLATFLLRSILWGQDDDPDKKYPLKGRIRYVWAKDNYDTVAVLFKEGPLSNSPEKKDIWKQIQSHETLIEWYPVERDRTYLIAKFRPIFPSYATSGKGSELLNEVMFNLEEKDKVTQRIAKEKFEIDSFQSLLDDPFDIFDNYLRSHNLSDLGMDFNKMCLSLKDNVLQSLAESEIDKTLKETGISGYKSRPLKIFGLSDDGTMKDILDDDFDPDKL